MKRFRDDFMIGDRAYWDGLEGTVRGFTLSGSILLEFDAEYVSNGSSARKDINYVDNFGEVTDIEFTDNWYMNRPASNLTKLSKE